MINASLANMQERKKIKKREIASDEVQLVNPTFKLLLIF